MKKTIVAIDDFFEITRADGRSNSQVICDLVGKCDPGKVLEYSVLSAELSNGSTKIYSVQDVQSCVRLAGMMLGRLYQRVLQNVKKVGYRIALADEHMSLAIVRQDKASRQLKRGFEIVRDVKWDEIKDPQVRKATEGYLLVISGFFYTLSGHERRLGRIEKLIDDMTRPNQHLLTPAGQAQA
mgnify:CR=1 FL=1